VAGVRVAFRCLVVATPSRLRVLRPELRLRAVGSHRKAPAMRECARRQSGVGFTDFVCSPTSLRLTACVMARAGAHAPPHALSTPDQTHRQLSEADGGIPPARPATATSHRSRRGSNPRRRVGSPSRPGRSTRSPSGSRAPERSEACRRRRHNHNDETPRPGLFSGLVASEQGRLGDGGEGSPG